LCKSIGIDTNSQRFIKNLHHRVRTFAIQARSAITKDFEERRRVTEAIVNQWRGRRRLPIYFRFPELTRSFNKDLLFEPPRKPGNPRKNLFVFIAKAQRSSTNRNKRWVEEELRKRFEELRNETLKMWIFKDSPFISWNEAYNHHK
jgi:hypothetical protein